MKRQLVLIFVSVFSLGALATILLRASGGDDRALDPSAKAPPSHRDLARMRDYEGAIKALTQKMQESPEDTSLGHELGELLFAGALVDRDRHDYRSAIDKLRRALKSGHPHARAQLAQLLVLTGARDEALGLLQEQAAKSPDLFSLEALTDLHLSLEQLGPAQENLDAYRQLKNAFEQRLQKGDFSTEEKRTAERMRAFFTERQNQLQLRRQMRSTGFVLERSGVEVRFFSRAAAPLAERTANVIKEVIEDLSGSLGSLSQKATQRVWLVEKEGFRAATDAPLWAAALFDGVIRIPLDASQLSDTAHWLQVLSLVRHEATHAHLYALCGDRMPVWIGEGLAQLSEGRSAAQALGQLKQALGKYGVSLREGESLERDFRSYEDPRDVQVLYLRALILADHLNKQYPGLWKSLITQTCTDEVPYPDSLAALTQSRSADDLWRKSFSALSE